MIEGGHAPRGAEKFGLPKPGDILDQFDSKLHGRALELGVPSLGEPRLTGTELDEKYHDLRRDHFVEVVALDRLQLIAEAGPVHERFDGEDHAFTLFHVQSTPEGHVVVSDSHHDADGTNGMIRYEWSPEREQVEVQDFTPNEASAGGTRRSISVSLMDNKYRFSSERRGNGEPMITAVGSFKDTTDGTITKAYIETGKFDG